MTRSIAVAARLLELDACNAARAMAEERERAALAAATRIAAAPRAHVDGREHVVSAASENHQLRDAEVNRAIRSAEVAGLSAKAAAARATATCALAEQRRTCAALEAAERQLQREDEYDLAAQLVLLAEATSLSADRGAAQARQDLFDKRACMRSAFGREEDLAQAQLSASRRPIRCEAATQFHRQERDVARVMSEEGRQMSESIAAQAAIKRALAMERSRVAAANAEVNIDPAHRVARTASAIAEADHALVGTNDGAIDFEGRAMMRKFGIPGSAEDAARQAFEKMPAVGMHGRALHTIEDHRREIRQQISDIQSLKPSALGYRLEKVQDEQKIMAFEVQKLSHGVELTQAYLRGLSAGLDENKRFAQEGSKTSQTCSVPSDACSDGGTMSQTWAGPLRPRIDERGASWKVGLPASSKRPGSRDMCNTSDASTVCSPKELRHRSAW